MILRCSGCRELFSTRWQGDVLPIMCGPCTYDFSEAVILTFPEAS